MEWQKVPLALVTVLAFTQMAMGENRTVPRAPIGPRPPITMEMVPPPAAIPVNTIRVDSWADQKLTVSYWDGAAWLQVTLETGKKTDISCAKCTGTIAVKYHDGSAIQQVTLKSGGMYVMGWAPQKGVWVLTNPPRLSDR